MGQPFVVVDAFSNRPFSGNPAAVCVMERAADEDWMVAVAREMNLSETAFLHPEGEGWRLRWLTPEVEVDLCGHATLASAHVLFESGRLPALAAARFFTRSGELGARRQGERVVLDFPTRAATLAEPLPGLEAALGAPARWVGRSQMDYLVELDSAERVRSLEPNMSALAAVDARAVIVTAPSDQREFHFVSRFFAPRLGVPEDPVTGSAHCVLGPFWSQRLGKTEMVGYQASRRGGVVHVNVRGPRMDLAGHAVTVSRGEILGPESVPRSVESGGK